MATIFDAAEYILEKIEEESIPYLKFERLCYYAQAWSMAWDEEPIFPEEFCAGEKGSVCDELFDGVGHQLFVSLADIPGDSDALSEDHKSTIDSMLDYYCEYSAKRLGDLVRSEFPWVDARELMKQNRHFRGIITKENMKKYYQTLL